MSRPTMRILSALLVLSAAACASPTAPVPARTRALSAPGIGASFDDVTPTPTDSTCRSGYMNGQGYTC
jgi:hypothetical protein